MTTAIVSFVAVLTVLVLVAYELWRQAQEWREFAHRMWRERDEAQAEGARLLKRLPWWAKHRTCYAETATDCASAGPLCHPTYHDCCRPNCPHDWREATTWVDHGRSYRLFVCRKCGQAVAGVGHLLCICGHEGGEHDHGSGRCEECECQHYQQPPDSAPDYHGVA